MTVAVRGRGVEGGRKARRSGVDKREGRVENEERDGREEMKEEGKKGDKGRGFRSHSVSNEGHTKKGADKH